jgi:hypothetical protein
MVEILAYEPDLLFSSRIEAAAAKAGLEVVLASTVEQLLHQLELFAPRIVFLNLDQAEGELARLEEYVKRGGSKFIGYYSHTNTKLVEEAQQMGLTLVLPRGAFVSRLDGIVEKLG